MAESGRILSVSDDERKQIRKILNYEDERTIKRDIDMVVTWYSKLTHMPRAQPLDRDFVERMLIHRKASVEQAKQKIETLCTLRSVMPEMTSPRDVTHRDFQQLFDTGTVIAALPRLNRDLTRIHFIRLSKKHENFVLADVLKYAYMIMEYRMKYDYYIGDRFVYDAKDLALGHLTKINIVSLKKAEVLLKAYGSRVFGIHFVNAPGIIANVLNIARSTLSDKIFGRIMVHTTIEDFYRVVDKDILCEEYGGKEKSLDDLSEEWKRELGRDEVRSYLRHQETLATDESKRVETRPTDDMLGIPGSFKTIHID